MKRSHTPWECQSQLNPFGQSKRDPPEPRAGRVQGGPIRRRSWLGSLRRLAWSSATSAPDLCPELLCESYRGLDLLPPDGHAFDVDAERNAERAAVGHEFCCCRDGQLKRRFERVGRMLEVVLDP